MRSVLAGLTALGLTVAAVAADLPGSADPPAFPKRFEGAVIVDYRQVDYDEARFVSGPVPAAGAAKAAADAAPRIAAAGRLTEVSYHVDKSRATVEVFQTYVDGLAAAGFETLYTCADAACGGRNFNLAVAPYKDGFGDNHAGQRYLLARRTRAEGDVTLSVYVTKAANVGGRLKDVVAVRVVSVEAKPREGRLEVVSAGEIAQALGEKGTVAIYGILFDFDKSDIKPESKPALDEIAKFLKANPAVSVYVVGHTDNAGTLDYNLGLSARRAEAVAAALQREHGIAAARLTARGVGPLAPVATNATEAGKARNRRVEIVAR